tara:strand:+ start:3225 stop:3857 length:633 start_codon:yes stop_codon:yes gene_type:complete
MGVVSTFRQTPPIVVPVEKPADAINNVSKENVSATQENKNVVVSVQSSKRTASTVVHVTTNVRPTNPVTKASVSRPVQRPHLICVLVHVSISIRAQDIVVPAEMLARQDSSVTKVSVSVQTPRHFVRDNVWTLHRLGYIVAHVAQVVQKLRDVFRACVSNRGAPKARRSARKNAWMSRATRCIVGSAEKLAHLEKVASQEPANNPPMLTL